MHEWTERHIIELIKKHGLVQSGLPATAFIGTKLPLACASQIINRYFNFNTAGYNNNIVSNTVLPCLEFGSLGVGTNPNSIVVTNWKRYVLDPVDDNVIGNLEGNFKQWVVRFDFERTNCIYDGYETGTAHLPNFSIIGIPRQYQASFNASYINMAQPVIPYTVLPPEELGWTQGIDSPGPTNFFIPRDLLTNVIANKLSLVTEPTDNKLGYLFSFRMAYEAYVYKVWNYDEAHDLTSFTAPIAQIEYNRTRRDDPLGIRNANGKYTICYIITEFRSTNSYYGVRFFLFKDDELIFENRNDDPKFEEFKEKYGFKLYYDEPEEPEEGDDENGT